MVSTLRLLLGGVRRAPKRAWIDAVWIEFEHRVIELARVRRCRVQAVEIAKVLPRLTNDAGIVVIFRHLVPGDDGFRSSRQRNIMARYVFGEELRPGERWKRRLITR